MKDLEIISISLNEQEQETAPRCCPGEYIGR